MSPVLVFGPFANESRSPIADDGEADIPGYNWELHQLGDPTWFDVPWLYSECYLYRWVTTEHELAA